MFVADLPTLLRLLAQRHEMQKKDKEEFFLQKFLPAICAFSVSISSPFIASNVDASLNI
jgi:hypothetical protein